MYWWAPLKYMLESVTLVIPKILFVWPWKHLQSKKSKESRNCVYNFW
jgi:hypothetical protein